MVRDALIGQLTLAERIAIVSANSKGVKFGIFNDMTASCGWQACKTEGTADMPSEQKSGSSSQGFFCPQRSLSLSLTFSLFF